MQQKELIQRIPISKEQLGQVKTEDISSRNQIADSLKQMYIQRIKMLISQLNHGSKEEKQVILQLIKQADQLYLETQGMSVRGQVLFSRHGECAIWGQKKFGVSPNSPISEEAARNMAATSEATKVLLTHPEKSPRIAVSPMIRAMQTASLIIPKDIQANISIEAYLSENSDAPSGLDVRSNQDLQEVSKKTPFLSLKRILFFLTNLFYGQKDFEALNEKRKEAADKIQKHNKPGQDIYKNKNIPQALDYDGDKIRDTKKLINETTEDDLWLIGHGKNFKTFFKEVFDIDRDFKFAETRVAYKIKAEGFEPTLYTPPYSLVVNQKTGEIEGIFTGVSKAATKDVRKEKPVMTTTQDIIEVDSLLVMRRMFGATNNRVITKNYNEEEAQFSDRISQEGAINKSLPQEREDKSHYEIPAALKLT
ncbi:TPA: histidine phosphatase family protein [Legionella pneumophila]|jgi:hypothetical protein|uniref:Histidine phosphatase family protein n=1 Tax=Legionella pneumophila TaxID=446 RepID=A0AAN5KSI2_LEGPN|nr:histidine phosphatase family protein [Legionella pneumophila]HAT1971299.1 histidine phosphatase family protein [Legionella pneumophila]HAT6956590.1 histidine phosphatase family protein [Legionella pneumophila]HEN4769605.1 histidine phosphatase family protein [Legionella pneumophila]